MMNNLAKIASEFRLYLVNHWLAVVPSHTIRLFCYRRFMRLKIGPGSSIFMGCHLDCSGGITIGENSTVNHGCRLDGRGGIQIGNSVAISSQVMILTADHDPDSLHFSHRIGTVKLDDYTFIGTGAIILKGVHIGTGAMVGAGSVVTRDIPPGEIWAGNPAQKIRMRQADQYNYTTKYRRLFQ